MLDVYRPYPGVALVVTEQGSILFGAPSDAFKATKAFCQRHQLPFPRVLVAPQRLVADANPQFAPEFFLYDFLFVYGAAFKPELDDERLILVLDASQVEEEKRTLAITLNGPSRAELAGYRDDTGAPLLDDKTVTLLANVSEHLAIKKGPRPRALDEMIEIRTFDRQAEVELFGGTLRIARTGPISFHLRRGKSEAAVDLAFEAPVVPFATLPVPDEIQTPLTFGIKPLGTRSGFDLSGPTTGFLLWVNGRAVVYDGPAGARYLLEHQGIAARDVAAVVLSHCHEDHMAAFVELILGGHRPRVYTAEPIYRSMLVKLAHHFRLGEAEVAALVDYQRVTPGTPIDIFGATFDFFYTVHAIPTIGMAVTMRGGDGGERRVQISGDTMHHDGLDKMLAEGVIDPETHARMRGLVPASSVENALYFADVGEALIHGHPRDWQDNPNRVLYYHCADDERTRGFGHELAKAGTTYALLVPPKLHPAVPGRLLHALQFLDFADPGWLAEFLHRGRTRHAETGEVIGGLGQPASTFMILVSGTAAVLRPDGSTLTHLGPGEFFGAIELIEGATRASATVRAATPLELFEIEGALFHAYVEAKGLAPRLARLWQNRPHIDGARVFRTLDLATRNRIAALGVEERFAAGEIVFTQGSIGDDFYLLHDGCLAVEIDGRVVREIDAHDHDNFFGEGAALSADRRRRETLRAKTASRVLRLRGRELRELLAGEMAVRYALLVATTQLGG